MVEVGQKRTWEKSVLNSGIWFAFITYSLMDKNPEREVTFMKIKKRNDFPCTEEEIKIARFQSGLSDLLSLYDISCAEFGRRTGMSRQHIYNLIDGKTKMSKTQYLATLVIFSGEEDHIEHIFNVCKEDRILMKEKEFKDLKERLET